MPPKRLNPTPHHCLEVYCHLKCAERQANKSRERCVRTLKYLHDELYVFKDKNALDKYTNQGMMHLNLQEKPSLGKITCHQKTNLCHQKRE